MKQIDTICQDAINEYRKLFNINKDKFIPVFTSEGSEISEGVVDSCINTFLGKKIPSKLVVPIKCTQIQSSKLIPYNINPYIEKSDKNKEYFKIREKTGLFRLDFSNGKSLLISRWMEGFAKNWCIRSIAVGESSTYFNYLKSLGYQLKKNSKPKNGVFRATFNPNFGIVEYENLPDIPDSPIIHPEVSNVERDLEFYFKNVSIYTRYKQSGVRKFMLISEPGTGKTSLFYKLARNNMSNKCVVFCTDINSMAAHLKSCAKHKVSTIIFLEDADSTLNTQNNGSGILNFLDGVDTPYNPAGALIIMSTNYPEKIEERILTRPGRIDKIYKFDALQDDYAFDCAKLYFGEYFDVDTVRDEVTKLAHGMTGAQIKELALSSMSYAASNEIEVNIELIKKVKKDFANNLKEAYRYAEANSLKKMTSSKHTGFGFNEPNDNW